MNRKKLLGLTAAAMIVLGVVANVKIATQKSGLSDISLANVEALAGWEITVGRPCAQTCIDCICRYEWDDGEVDEIEGKFYD